MVLEEKFKDKTGGKYPFIRFKDVSVDKRAGSVSVTVSVPYDVYDGLTSGGETEIISSAISEIFMEEGVTMPVSVIYKKVYYNADIIKRLTEKFLAEQYGAYCSQISQDAVTADIENGVPLINVDVPDYLAGAFTAAEIPEAIADYIDELYGTQSKVTVTRHAADAFRIDDSAPKMEAVQAKQYFHSTSGESVLVGKPITDSALYISRLPENAFETCVAGTISDLQDRVSKKGYHFHTFTLNDTTGSLDCIMFTRRKKGGVLGALTDGMTIKTVGSFEDENNTVGKRKFIVDRVSFCDIDYSAVDDSEPQKAFDKTPVPIISYSDSADSLEQILTETNPLLAGRTYVSLDFETTGLNPAACKVIEVGIARMTDGKVVEYFDTFVDPGIPIPRDASEKNNIYDKDVQGAPPIEYVLPQMLEFIGNSPVIAHNGNNYDYILLGRLLKEAGAEFRNKLIDTLEMANYLRIPCKHNLGDLCRYFHIPLVNAHRAYADCIATAKLFAELVRYGNLKTI